MSEKQSQFWDNNLLAAEAKPKYPDSPGFVRGSDTSEAAADKVTSSAATMRAKVAKFVRDRGSHGATCDEVAYGLGMLHQTASARVTELKHKQIIFDSGERRPTRTGAKAAVLLHKDLSNAQGIDTGERGPTQSRPN